MKIVRFYFFHSFWINSDKISPPRPFKKISIISSIAVRSLFTNNTFAPLSFAMEGKKFAGDTSKELPIIIKQSQDLQAFIALSNSLGRNGSPNSTTFGFLYPLHSQMGYFTFLVSTSSKRNSFLHLIHYNFSKEPCNS